MVACFGLHEAKQRSRFPADRLVENRARLNAVALYHAGVLVDGAETEVRVGEKPYHLATHAPNLRINGSPVLIIWDIWARPYFECPRCGKRRQHLYLDGLACRACLRLDYASRHVHQHLPAVHRVARLRRKIGADPRPFSALPPHPKAYAPHFDRICTQIRAEEAKLVGHLGTVVHDLKRRIRSRKAKRQW